MVPSVGLGTWHGGAAHGRRHWWGPGAKTNYGTNEYIVTSSPSPRIAIVVVQLIEAETVCDGDG